MGMGQNSTITDPTATTEQVIDERLGHLYTQLSRAYSEIDNLLDQARRDQGERPMRTSFKDGREPLHVA